MIRKKREQLARMYVLSDVLAILLSFFASFWLRFHSAILAVPKGIPLLANYLIIIPFLLLMQLIYFSYQGFYRFKLRRNRLDDLFLIILNSSISSFVVLLIFSYFKSYGFIHFEISHIFTIVYAPVSILSLSVCRMLMFTIFKKVSLARNGVSRILIAGQDDLAEMTAANLLKYRHFGLEVAGFLGPEQKANTLGNCADLKKVVEKHGITDLFIALPLKEYSTIMKLIETGNNLLLDIRLVPDILQLASLKAGVEHIEGLPIINLGDIPLEGWPALSKRIFDFLVSLAGLIFFLPLIALTAVFLKLDSAGPLFYLQTRVGLDGRIFRMIKFRTMVKNAEMETGPIWSPQNDQRVTRLGRILRKLSIDELPQLLNVLSGEMSLVGPRPERPELVEKFKKNIPRYMLRHRVKTGMTGWAQVHGLRGNTPLDKRIEFDIYYIQNWTLRLDLEILFRTILKFKFIDKNN
jgi:exopolysaccharide biosynthesis polyprenyl glycosylphosphotransferase